jgi:hypothetical protein
MLLHYYFTIKWIDQCLYVYVFYFLKFEFKIEYDSNKF